MACHRNTYQRVHHRGLHVLCLTLFPTGSADFLAPRINDDKRFAVHPRFRYFALNTEMRWRALQADRVYVNQHPNDARLSVDELRDMKVKLSPIVSCTMPPIFAEPGNTGPVNGAGGNHRTSHTVLHSQCC